MALFTSNICKRYERVVFYQEAKVDTWVWMGNLNSIFEWTLLHIVLRWDLPYFRVPSWVSALHGIWEKPRPYAHFLYEIFPYVILFTYLVCNPILDMYSFVNQQCGWILCYYVSGWKKDQTLPDQTRRKVVRHWNGPIWIPGGFSCLLRKTSTL